MRFAPLALVSLVLLAFPAAASARVDATSPITYRAPAGMKAFLLRADEPARHTFNRTPSFSWRPVRGALRYEFEIATTRTFTEGSTIWSNAKDGLAGTPSTTTPATTGAATGTSTPATPTASTTSVYDDLRSPAISIDVALPWVTGSPYALYAHARAVTPKGATAWSKPYGFNVRWTSVPRDLDSPYPGLIRWSPVEGATAYQVWIFGSKRTFMTTTNVADARELYTFHRADPFYTSQIAFRVRAQRSIYGDVVSGLPATTWGPWSPIYTDPQPPLSLGAIRNVATVSDVVADSADDRAHALMPGFVFGGDQGGPGDTFPGVAELFRVYIATDRDCVNVVYRGAVVGSPAYAPRTTGPLILPGDQQGIDKARTDVLDSGSEPEGIMLDGSPSITNENSSAGAAGGSTGGSGSSTTPTSSGAKTDLPDTAWPSGGYYWTVVPVHAIQKPLASAPVPGASLTVEYRETELPQDACQSGRVARFGKSTPPVVTSSNRPFASGLSANGRLTSALRRSPSFYGTPLVAWMPALGASEYEIQWSRTASPWRPVGSLRTAATSALLPLAPGTWHYRVRGYNYLLLKRPEMTWSRPTALKVAKPTFAVVKTPR